MFAQVITKDVFLNPDELDTNGHIVIRNETFINEISISEYTKYLNGNPEEKLEDPMLHILFDRN